MVDSVSGSGQFQNIQPTNKAQKSTGDKGTSASAARSSDEVAISSEALSLIEAQNIAESIGVQVADDTSLTLSSDVERLNQLA